MARAYIGTSGWNYREWRGSFFPEDLPSRQWLSYYATRFDSVEINYTFYRLPSKEACAAWYQQTPRKFQFVVKASRYITHIKRLRDARESWEEFLKRVAALKEKLGPILLQFPANFRASEANLESVDEFLEIRESRRFATNRNGISRSLLLRFGDAATPAPSWGRARDFSFEQIPVA